MHSKSNKDYTIHFNGDFSGDIKYYENLTNCCHIIPEGVVKLLYAAIVEDVSGDVSGLLSDKIWEVLR